MAEKYRNNERKEKIAAVKDRKKRSRIERKDEGRGTEKKIKREKEKEIHARNLRKELKETR
jgi:hypothetical protein